MNNNVDIQQGFFTEILKKDDVDYVAKIFKNFYDLIQKKKEIIQGQTVNSLKSLADVKAKSADLHNWILYKYGSGSVADYHLEIIRKIMDGNIEELNAIENIVHTSNQTRGIRQVDEFLSTFLNGKQESFHSEKMTNPVGDIQNINIHLNKNHVNQNNLTDPKNPLNVIQQGVQVNSVIKPRHLNLVEQMNGTENMLINVLNPINMPKTQNQTITVRPLN